MTRLNVDKRERHGAVSGHLPEFIFGGLEPVAKLLTLPVQRALIPEYWYVLPPAHKSVFLCTYP